VPIVLNKEDTKKIEGTIKPRGKAKVCGKMQKVKIVEEKLERIRENDNDGRREQING